MATETADGPSDDTATVDAPTTDRYELSAMQQRDLEKIANKDVTTAILLGFFISPLGYVYVGKWGWALFNFVTLNYVLFGMIIVPLHARKMIHDARDELALAGVKGY